MAMELDAPRFGGDLARGTARGLGWFSVGLGLAECLMPRAVARAVGMAGRESVVRAYGLRAGVVGRPKLEADRRDGERSGERRILSREKADAAGHNRPVRAATPVRELIDAALSRVRTQAVERRIDVEVTAEPGVPEIFVDRERLADAIANLVENAIKFSPSGRRVAVSIAKSDRHISIAVRDQGAGIAPGELRRIFEPYYRGALGDQENVRGTGLGLALVHTTVEAHGGRIDVVSAPAQGSTFTIYLPLGGPA